MIFEGDKMERKYGYGEWVIRFRWWIILATMLFVVAAASGARFLDFSSDYREFFSKENPQLQAFDALQNTYTKNDNVMIALAPKDGQVFTRENLAAVEDLTKQAWQIPYSIRVESVTNFQHSWADGDGLVVEDLVKNAMSLSDLYLERKKQIALSEPLLINRLISPSSHVTGINVTINLPGKTITEVPEVAKFVRDMADDFRSNHPEFNVYLTGVAMINNQFVESGQQDMQTLVSIDVSVDRSWHVGGSPLFGRNGVHSCVDRYGHCDGIGHRRWWGILLTPVSPMLLSISSPGQ